MSNYRNISKMLKALSHPHRLHIFLQLSKICTGGTKSDVETRACVGQAGKGLRIAPSTLSHHIKELKQAGLLHIETSGQHRQCGVNAKALVQLKEFFEDLGRSEC